MGNAARRAVADGSALDTHTTPFTFIIHAEDSISAGGGARGGAQMRPIMCLNVKSGEASGLEGACTGTERYFNFIGSVFVAYVRPAIERGYGPNPSCNASPLVAAPHLGKKAILDTEPQPS